VTGFRPNGPPRLTLTELGELVTGGPIVPDPLEFLTPAGMAEAAKQDRIDQARRAAAWRTFFGAAAAWGVFDLFEVE
jgi:hypothetical protein